jgi:hypothetical protein
MCSYMSTQYVVHDPQRPHIVLFAAATMSEVAAAVAAQPNAEELWILAHRDGTSRELDAAERSELGALRARLDDGSDRR